MEIRLLGGFEAHGDASPVTSFESQKVRALLAYLAVHEGRSFSRDQIGALLWSDADPEAARRNLRQALYNLRQSLRELDGALRVDHQTVGLYARPEDSIDVVELVAAHRRGLPGDGHVAVTPLRRVAELYRGELLAGFHVRDAAAFEEWLARQQERLREVAIESLTALVDHFAARGEYEPAIAHGRRLVELDPLSEQAHRELMRLYVLAGRRRRALAQYDELVEVLRRELGVAPLTETRRLHQSILAEELPGAEAGRAAARSPGEPLVPLVGRDDELAALARSFRAAAGGARLALVEGPPGIGKTRLVKSFLDRLSSRQQALVVHARCFEESPGVAGQPFRDLLAGLDGLEGEATAGSPGGGPGDGDDATALLARLRELPRRPVALFVDGLHHADAATWQALADLLDAAADLPVWLVATADGGAAGGEGAGTAAGGDAAPAAGAARTLAGHPRADRLRPSPLTAAEIGEIAAALLGAGEAAERLAAPLVAASGGLPLAVVERINALSDDGVLVPIGERRWALEGDPAASPAAGLPLAELIARRVQRLPSSTRRLLSLAAVIGPTFDAELLQRAAGEHLAVVEIALEVLLERRLVRQVARRWSASPRERDLVMWAQGARRGGFEASHELVRGAVLAGLPDAALRRIHGEVAAALEERAADGSAPAAALLDHHRAAAAGDQKKNRAPR
ncbi:MAG TPA: BTAD domain-containing putative transcriptional regulator [Thermoanaerobaculia bacterium]